MYIRNYVRNLRLQKGYTLERLSKISGVSISEISSIENGIIKDPGIYVCSVLAHALKVNVSDLFVLKEKGRRV